jgi:hypothetical protein
MPLSPWIASPALRTVAGRAAFLTAILIALLLVHAPYFDLALKLWLVALAAIVAWALTAGTLTAWPSVAERRRSLDPRGWRRRSSRERVRDLEELEHAVEFSVTTAFDFHFRLRPHLVGIAAHRLALRGIDLDHQPERARALLGEETWQLLRPDRPAPEARNASGLPLRTLQRVVEKLDAV